MRFIDWMSVLSPCSLFHHNIFPNFVVSFVAFHNFVTDFHYFQRFLHFISMAFGGVLFCPFFSLLLSFLLYENIHVITETATATI